MCGMLKLRLIKDLHKTSGYHAGLCTLSEHEHQVLAVAVSPDGKRIASGSRDRTIRI